MNFLFAFAVFVVVFGTWGLDTVESTVVAPRQDSVAERAGLQAGDVILQVNATPVTNAYELLQALEATGGRGAVLDIERNGARERVELPPIEAADFGIDILLPTTVGSTDPGTPAAGVGLRRGDHITAVDEEPVNSWSAMREHISARPGERIELTWIRDGVVMSAPIVPAPRQDDGRTIGVIGIRPLEAGSVAVGWMEAARLGAQSVYSSSYLILDFIGKIFENEHYKELGGPIRIAKMADDTAAMGAKYFLRFLALLSVNLAILNLLPIPVLDGGHLTFLTLEAIMRRPPSVRQREVAQQVGLAIILFIMVAVTFNDLNEFVFQHIIEFFR